SNHHASAQEFRDLHRQTLIDFDSVLRTFKNLLEKYGGSDLKAWLLYLNKSIGAELKAVPASSVEPNKLLAILHELSQMKWLITMLEDLGERLKRFRRRFHQQDDEDDKMIAISEAPKRDKLLLGILTLAEAKWVTSEDIERSAETCPLPSTEAKIYLLRELLDFLRRMPLLVFGDRIHRMRMVEAAQDALDGAIDLEES
ncbi:MAG: TyeA family type III secretion system gatekeeper subunit, partial [Geminicoccaceae bacterium]